MSVYEWQSANETMLMKQYVFYLIMMSLSFSSMPVRAVEYRLADLNGQLQSLQQYRGKWVVVNFWASWCHTCIKELPDLIALHEQNRDSDIVVIGVNFEELSEARLKSFVAEHAIPYPVWRSDVVPMTPLGQVPALPTTYIVDPDGKPVAGEVGVVSRQQIEDYIASKRSVSRQAELVDDI